MKSLFKRVDGIALSLVFFYCLITVFVAICLDPNSTIVMASNPIASLATAFGFVTVTSVGLPTYIMVSMIAVYTFLFALAVVIEVRLAGYYEEKPYSAKWLSIMAASFVVLYALAIGIGSASHLAFDDGASLIVQSLAFSGECLLLALVVALVLYLSIFFLVLLIYCVFYRAKGLPDTPSEESEEAKKLDELEAKVDAALDKDEGDVSKAFSLNASGQGPVGTGTGPLEGDDFYHLQKERVFPSLSQIDEREEMVEVKTFKDDDSIDLKTLTDDFRDYLAGKEGLYYEKTAVRAFIAGLSASRMMILQGLSGTGKSSIARFFSSFISEESFFVPVQATWRDRTSILGFWNDFSRTYSETEFLKRLYLSTYRSQDINVMVLDEMNIARIEYYFADFLSVMEYPLDKRVLKIMNLPYDFDPPAHLAEGNLRIPETTWFIGTANRDDSTYTITDKVYDRSIVISFNDRNEPFEVKKTPEPISISYEKLTSLFRAAQEDQSYRLSKADWNKFRNVLNRAYEDFELTFGNRVYHQIELFVPVFVACGGTKEEALDFMFAEKIASKLEGRYEDFVKDALIALRGEIEHSYGKNGFPLTRERIAHFLRRFN